MAPIPSQSTTTTELSASFHKLTQLPRELFAHLTERLPQLHPRDALPSLHDLIAPSTTSPQKRQYTTIAIPASYAGVRPNSGSLGPAPGTVVGIVLGSVAGFILLVWLLWTLANSQNRESNVVAESVEVVRERPLEHRPRSSRRSHRSRRETVVMRERSRSPTVRGGTERIIVEERRTSRAPSVIPERRETIIVEERREHRVDGDDIVEVIEEGSVSSVRTPPRKERRRRSPSGGYRSVDPNLFGGGDYPQHHIHRDRSLSSRS